MKKICICFLCIFVMTSLLACKKAEKPVENENAQIANPFQTCKTIEAAEDIAGLTITVPDGIQGYESPIIQAIKDEMVQVIYKKEGQVITVRKANSVEDVSGDYNEYKQEKKVPIVGRNVTMKGNDDYIYLATWKDGANSFAITVSGEGLTEEEMRVLIEAVE